MNKTWRDVAFAVSLVAVYRLVRGKWWDKRKPKKYKHRRGTPYKWPHEREHEEE